MKKNIVITGSSSQLGQILIKSLKKNYLILHSNKKKIKKNFIANFNNKKMTDNFCDNINSLDKKIDLLIHLPSGKLGIKNFYKYNWNEFLSQINIQLRSLHILLSKLIYNDKISKKFKLIVITSDILNEPKSGMVNYYCAKGMLSCYITNFNNEFKDKFKAFEIRPAMFKSPLLNKIPNFIVEKYAQNKNILEKKIVRIINKIMRDKEKNKIINIK